MRESVDRRVVLLAIAMILGSVLLGFAVNVSKAQDKAIRVQAVVESCEGLLSCNVTYSLDGPRTGTYIPPDDRRPTAGDSLSLVIYDIRTNRLYDAESTRQITIPVGVAGAGLLVYGSVSLFKHWRKPHSGNVPEQGAGAP